MAEQKPLKPSQKRLREARKDGKVLKSQLLTQAVSTVLASLATLYIFKIFLQRNRILLEYILVQGFCDPVSSLLLMARVTGVIIATVLLLVVLLAFAVEALQVGFKVELKPLVPSIARSNPANGFKKIFSGIKELWQPLTKLIILIVILVLFFKEWLKGWPYLVQSNQGSQLMQLQSDYLTLCTNGGLVLIVFGIIDLYFKRKSYLKELSMSHDEVRREYREDEGDPHVKSMRKAMHQSVLEQDLVRRIRKARVIIVE